MKKTGSGTKYTGTVVLGRNERQEQFVSWFARLVFLQLFWNECTRYLSTLC
jgi:hypothetical protein